MPRVTRRQAAAASSTLDDTAPAATTTKATTKDTTKAATKKRPIASSKVTDNNDTDGADDSQLATAKYQPKKRKTAKSAKAAKAVAGKGTPKVKDESEDEKPAQPAVENGNEKKAEKVPVAEGGIANSKDLVIPMDTVAARDGRLTADFTVYIDPSGMIYDASLNQTNAMNNNNKFYHVQVNQLASPSPPHPTPI